VPSNEERAGNFGHLCTQRTDAQGNPDVFDASGNCTTAGGAPDPNGQIYNLFAQPIPQAFPFNQLPFINAISQNLLAYYPAANSGPFTFVGTQMLTSSNDQFGIRVDQYLSEKDQLEFRYSFSQGSQTDPLSTAGANCQDFPGAKISERRISWPRKRTHSRRRWFGLRGSPSPGGLIPTQRTGFAPRVGLAWDVKGNGQWLVTAAYGIFYDPYYTGEGGPLQTPISAPPYLQTPQIQVPNFADPYNGQNPFNGSFAQPMTLLTLDPNLRLPYAQDWNLNIERAFGKDWLLQVGYNGVPLALSPDTDTPPGGIPLEQLNNYEYVNAVGSGDPKGLRSGGVTPRGHVPILGTSI